MHTGKHGCKVRTYSDLTTIVDGNPITVIDSICAPLNNVSVHGACKQFVTTGKNKLPHKMNGDAYLSGVALTNNGDGSFTLNGTARKLIKYIFINPHDNIYDEGSIFSGCPDGGSKDTYWLELIHCTANGGIITICEDYGDGVAIHDKTDDAPCVMIRLKIPKGVTVENLTFYPMIRPAGTDDSFEPYTGGVSSPNPSYPQEITAPGDNGSVEIVMENLNKTQRDSATLSLSEPLYGIGDVCDEISLDGIVKRFGKIDSYNGEKITGKYISSTGELSTGATVIYELEEPIVGDLTNEQRAALEDLQTFEDGTIVSIDDLATLEIEYFKDTDIARIVGDLKRDIIELRKLVNV